MRNLLRSAILMLPIVLLSVAVVGPDALDQVLFFTIVGAVSFVLVKGFFEGSGKVRQDKGMAQ